MQKKTYVELVVDGLNLAHYEKANPKQMNLVLIRCMKAIKKHFHQNVGRITIISGVKNDTSHWENIHLHLSSKLQEIRQKKNSLTSRLLFQHEKYAEEESKIMQQLNKISVLLKIYNHIWWTEEYPQSLLKELKKNHFYLSEGIKVMPVKIFRKRNGYEKIEREDDLAIATVIGALATRGNPVVLFTNDKRLIEVPFKILTELQKTPLGAIVRDESVYQELQENLGKSVKILLLNGNTKLTVVDPL